MIMGYCSVCGKQVTVYHGAKTACDCKAKVTTTDRFTLADDGDVMLDNTSHPQPPIDRYRSTGRNRWLDISNTCERILQYEVQHEETGLCHWCDVPTELGDRRPEVKGNTVVDHCTCVYKHSADSVTMTMDWRCKVHGGLLYNKKGEPMMVEGDGKIKTDEARELLQEALGMFGLFAAKLYVRADTYNNLTMRIRQFLEKKLDNG